eukprot:6203390-Pleurochrysis_carterae.AAC.3
MAHLKDQANQKPLKISRFVYGEIRASAPAARMSDARLNRCRNLSGSHCVGRSHFFAFAGTSADAKILRHLEPKAPASRIGLQHALRRLHSLFFATRLNNPKLFTSLLRVLAKRLGNYE